MTDNKLAETYLNEDYLINKIMIYKKWSLPTAREIAREFIDYYKQYSIYKWSDVKWSACLVRYLGRTSRHIKDDYDEWVELIRKNRT